MICFLIEWEGEKQRVLELRQEMQRENLISSLSRAMSSDYRQEKKSELLHQMVAFWSFQIGDINFEMIDFAGEFEKSAIWDNSRSLFSVFIADISSQLFVQSELFDRIML